MAREIEISQFDSKKNKSKVVVKPVRKIKPVSKPLSKPPVKVKAKTEVVPSVPAKPKDRKAIIKDLSSMNNADLLSHGHALVEQIKTDSVFDQNRQQLEQYADMFSRSVRIANIFETKLLHPAEGKEPQSKDVYALIKLYEEIREIIADMKALQDVNEYTQRLDEDVLIPFARGSAAIMLTLVRNIEKHAEKFLSAEEAKSMIEFVRKTGINSGVNIQDLYDIAKDQTHKAIIGG